MEQELVITSVLPTEALYVQMDPTQMNRVITNLIQNSIKFADPTKEQLAFTISLTHNQTDLVLTITDNGIGIDKRITLFIRTLLSCRQISNPNS